MISDCKPHFLSFYAIQPPATTRLKERHEFLFCFSIVKAALLLLEHCFVAEGNDVFLMY